MPLTRYQTVFTPIAQQQLVLLTLRPVPYKSDGKEAIPKAAAPAPIKLSRISKSRLSVSILSD